MFIDHLNTGVIWPFLQMPIQHEPTLQLDQQKKRRRSVLKRQPHSVFWRLLAFLWLLVAVSLANIRECCMRNLNTNLMVCTLPTLNGMEIISSSFHLHHFL